MSFTWKKYFFEREKYLVANINLKIAIGMMIAFPIVTHFTTYYEGILEVFFIIYLVLLTLMFFMLKKTKTPSQKDKIYDLSFYLVLGLITIITIFSLRPSFLF